MTNSSETTSAMINIQAGESFRVSSCDYHRKTLPEQNAFKYIAGYLINNCLKIHNCAICKQFSQGNDLLDNSNLFVHFKAYNTNASQFGQLKTPHESFYNFLYMLENTFFKNIQGYICTKGVGKSL